jgi:hypothetical protein
MIAFSSLKESIPFSQDNMTKKHLLQTLRTTAGGKANSTR